MNALAQRVITALVLLPLLLAAIFCLQTPALYLALGVVGVAAAWEWTHLMGWTALWPRVTYMAAMAVVLALAWLSTAFAYGPITIAAVAALWWLLAAVLVRGFPGSFPMGAWSAARMVPLGLLLLPSTLLSLAELHAPANGSWRLMFLFFIVFAADVGAFLAGRNFGKRKLAPAVSPAKSVEGAIGGLILVLLWACAAGPLAFQLSSPSQLLLLVLISLLTGLFSIIGDLTESLFKRLRGIKDSGKLLPGHGGVLDRIDSILAAAPIFYLGVRLSGL